MYRGGEAVVDSHIPLLHNNVVYFHKVQMIHCVTLRRKHCVVAAIKPGDKLGVFIAPNILDKTTIHMLEANLCVVYDGGGHLLLEVNSELLSKDAS